MWRATTNGVIEQRSCGYPLESYGYSEHLREIHSFRKLTGEGVTLVGNEMVRILEEVLPARFGGSPFGLDRNAAGETDGAYLDCAGQVDAPTSDDSCKGTSGLAKPVSDHSEFRGGNKKWHGELELMILHIA